MFSRSAPNSLGLWGLFPQQINIILDFPNKICDFLTLKTDKQGEL